MPCLNWATPLGNITMTQNSAAIKKKKHQNTEQNSNKPVIQLFFKRITVYIRVADRDRGSGPGPGPPAGPVDRDGPVRSRSGRSAGPVDRDRSTGPQYYCDNRQQQASARSRNIDNDLLLIFNFINLLTIRNCKIKNYRGKIGRL